MHDEVWIVENDNLTHFIFFFTADPDLTQDLTQDPASLRCWSLYFPLHYSLPDDVTCKPTIGSNSVGLSKNSVLK